MQEKDSLDPQLAALSASIADEDAALVDLSSDCDSRLSAVRAQEEAVAAATVEYEALKGEYDGVVAPAPIWANPVVLIAGGVDLESHADLSKVFKGVFSISNGPNTLEQAMADTPKLMVQMGVNLGQLIQSLPTSPNA